jgi:hypothetical protein
MLFSRSPYAMLLRGFFAFVLMEDISIGSMYRPSDFGATFVLFRLLRDCID